MQRQTLADMWPQQQVVVVVDSSGRVKPADVPLGIELDIMLPDSRVERWLCCADCKQPVRREDAVILESDPHHSYCATLVEDGQVKL